MNSDLPICPKSCLGEVPDIPRAAGASILPKFVRPNATLYPGCNDQQTPLTNHDFFALHVHTSISSSSS